MGKFPGPPLPIEDIREVREVNGELHILRFVQGGAVNFKLVTFPPSVDFKEKISLAHDWCKSRSYRFVFLESAVEHIT